MAKMKGIAAAVAKNTAASGGIRPGGRVPANFTMKTTKNRGSNKGSFGRQGNSTAKSVNTGGNGGPVGYA